MTSTKKMKRIEADYVSHPGETLQEILEERGMSQSELARRMGRPLKTINEIIHNKAAITSDTARQLMRVLGTPDDFWIRREGAYRRELSRLREVAALTHKTDWLDRFPVRDMVKFGWIERSQDKVQQLIILLDFLGIASPEQWELTDTANVAFRASVSSKLPPHAVSAWLTMGERQATNTETKPYDRDKFEGSLQLIRAFTTRPPDEFIKPLVKLCADCGVALVFTRSLPKTGVYGATRWLSNDKALVQMCLRYETDGQFWFTFFHKAGHILLHGKRASFIEGMSSGEEEDAANVFAREILIPSDAYSAFCKKRMTKAAIESFASRLGVAPGIVVGRLQRDGFVAQNCFRTLKAKVDLATVAACLAA